jgi:ATP-dependent helicase/nuclease subunit B
MFEPCETPRFFAMPCGADFSTQLVDGVIARMAHTPPEAMTKIEIYLNTPRMMRHVRVAFDKRGARLLPRLRLLTDLADAPLIGLPPAVPSLRRRLELAQLVGGLTQRMPEFSAGTNLYSLADSLAQLLAEMQQENVHPAALAGLNIAENHASHWQRSLEFINIIAPFFDDPDMPDRNARMRMVVDRLGAQWAETPPEHPIIIAGSTGSRGATAAFMQAVARLPQGAVVLPGFDAVMPAPIWDALTTGRMPLEDHPQYRFAALCAQAGLAPNDIPLWDNTPEPAPARSAVISLALRPAPVTDQWIEEGKNLPDIAEAMAGVTLIEAPDLAREALAVALVLREAAEHGVRAALITPDRMLTRRVAAALGRWGIIPDDSAGEPLQLSAPGRFLRHAARAMTEPMTIETLLILLKHPLTATGAEWRGNHMIFARELDLRLRKHGPAFPTAEALIAWAEVRNKPGQIVWANWLAQVLRASQPGDSVSLGDWFARHLAFCELLAAGPEGDVEASELWRKDAGGQARQIMEDLRAELEFGGDCTGPQYCDLIDELLGAGSVRHSEEVDPMIAIWGTLEARVQGADLVVLAGLNEGVWPAAPAPDPWLSRQMRHEAGLLLPERQVGLSAHDFQQAFAAKRVVLTRSVRDSEAQTVRSRWLNRLLNMTDGLPERRGPEAIAAMRARGTRWLDQVRALERVTPVAAAARPSPRPPEDVRPRELPVTDISKLIRDPYEIYAKRILRLRKLDPIRPNPDGRLRGEVLHLIAEGFTKAIDTDLTALHPNRMMEIAEEVLTREVPWPTARRLWLARIKAISGVFVEAETERRAHGRPVVLEETGGLDLGAPVFRLTARPDRIDLLTDGTAHVYDYKSGTPPKDAEMRQFEKQLLLEAIMVEKGAFKALGPTPVSGITYLRLGGAGEVAGRSLSPDLLDETWRKLKILIGHYMRDSQGFTARRAPQLIKYGSDYDLLSRYGEWRDVNEPVGEEVGR